MRIVSYNILNPYHAILWKNHEGFDVVDDKPIDNWPRRKIEIVSNLKNSKFSVACLQEVNRQTLQDLSKDFTVAGFSFHKSDKEEATHGVALLYDPAKVKLLGLKFFKSLEKSRGEVYADFYDQDDQGIGRTSTPTYFLLGESRLGCLSFLFLSFSPARGWTL